MEQEKSIDKQMDEVVEKRNHADYDCYMILKDLMNSITPESLKRAIAQENGGDTELAEELIEEINDRINSREELNEKFMKLLQEGMKKIHQD